MNKDKAPDFIITIGASAGGLNAISEVVAQFSEEMNVAVFIVLHLSKVGMGEFILSRIQKYTQFTCIIPKDGEKIEARHIYVAPPDIHMVVKDGNIGHAHGPAENRWRPSIDVLFRSAAASYGSQVIGVILTGYLNDGATGMSAIKRNNGYCIVQDPNEAEYPDMPLSVLEMLEVDYCVSLNKIGEAVSAIIKNAKPENLPPEPQVLKEAEIAEKNITSIDAVSQLGVKALYSCPDCGGGLWHVDADNLKKYRCHVGHSYSQDDLLIKQSESLEATMWIALRMMEERRMLLDKISEEESRKGFIRMANLHKVRGEDLKVHIDKLKEILYQTQKD